METTESHAPETIDLPTTLAPILARWKVVLFLTFIGALIGFLVATYQPKVYRSTATIYAKQKASADLLRGLPLAIDTGFGSPSGYYVMLLQSETMLEKVISRLHLTTDRTFTCGKKLTKEKALLELKRCVDVKENRSGGIDIVTRAGSPYLAARIGNAMLDELGGMVVTSSQRKVGFISDKMQETNRDLLKAEDDIRRFEEAYGIAAVDEQTKTFVQELSELDGKLLSIDVELEQVKARLANSGDLDSLIDDDVRKKALESSREYVVKKRAEYLAKLDALPTIATKYARLQRKIAVLTRTYQILTEQYQFERITRQGEDGDYQIIDRAQPRTKKIAPRRGMSTVAGAVMGFMFCSILVSLVPVRKRKKSR